MIRKKTKAVRNNKLPKAKKLAAKGKLAGRRRPANEM
jgi:hypothetical protein